MGTRAPASLPAVVAVLALVVLAGWLVVTVEHLYFGVVWVPLLLVAARRARVTA